MKILFVVLLVLAAASLAFPVWRMNTEGDRQRKRLKRYHEEQQNAQKAFMGSFSPETLAAIREIWRTKK